MFDKKKLYKNNTTLQIWPEAKSRLYNDYAVPTI